MSGHAPWGRGTSVSVGRGRGGGVGSAAPDRPGTARGRRGEGGNRGTDRGTAVDLTDGQRRTLHELIGTGEGDDTVPPGAAERMRSRLDDALGDLPLTD